MFRQIFPLIRRCGQNFACRNRSINGKRTYMLTPWFSPSNPFKSLERQIREMERHFENFFGRGIWNEFVPYKGSDDLALMESFRLRNPVVEEDGVKKYLLEFDVRRYKPEEISIVTNAKARTLTINAKHIGENSTYEFSRTMSLPEGVEPREIKCRFTSGGSLQVSAPYNPSPQEPEKSDTEINVKHE
ncbi:unnamed protein product [Dracunculus medinensis]|uniref:SHSP domain-containing protein n=1 Tax=Dracunculus medinensis TaxID=318479 RepID=A0A0N4U487_DRAME|nr:unnamed protein product [Dracunculus medinensis]